MMSFSIRLLKTFCIMDISMFFRETKECLELKEHQDQQDVSDKLDHQDLQE